MELEWIKKDGGSVQANLQKKFGMLTRMLVTELCLDVKLTKYCSRTTPGDCNDKTSCEQKRSTRASSADVSISANLY